jgi:hypothetical protein
MPKAKGGREGLQREFDGRKGEAIASTIGADSPDPWATLGRLDQALSLVAVCHRSLAAKGCADVGDEEEVLRQGIELLRNVRNEFDHGLSIVSSGFGLRPLGRQRSRAAH